VDTKNIEGSEGVTHRGHEASKKTTRPKTVCRPIVTSCARKTAFETMPAPSGTLHPEGKSPTKAERCVLEKRVILLQSCGCPSSYFLPGRGFKYPKPIATEKKKNIRLNTGSTPSSETTPPSTRQKCSWVLGKTEHLEKRKKDGATP